MNEQLEFIYKRRSIRKYLDQPVDDALIEALLSAAMAAPSGMNMQPWNFVVVRDANGLSDLRKTSPFAKMNAPCAIVVCGNLGTFKRPLLEHFWVQDCSAATENLLLAATALGLGAVWCGVHPIKRLEEKVSKVLDLPKSVIPLAMVFVGYGSEEQPARTQYDASKIYREKFGHSWIG
jgi:nitroreductase